MRRTVALVVLVTFSSAVSAADRDWTLEHPVAAGFFQGLALGFCQQCQLGQQRVAASPYDDFAVTPWVAEVLEAKGGTPYRLGFASGLSVSMLVILGVFFRRLHTLRARAVLGAGSISGHVCEGAGEGTVCVE